MLAYLKGLPPDSALGRELEGEGWTTTDHFLAAVVDLLNVGNWQRQGDPKKRKPKLVARPGVSVKDSDSVIARKAEEFRKRQRTELEPE